MDSQGGYVLKILYVKTKESGPLGGGGVRQASANVDPPMHNESNRIPHHLSAWILVSLQCKDNGTLNFM